MRAYKLYLIRCGLTRANFDGRYIGTTDLDLCEEGVAELVELSRKYEYPGAGKVYSSPLKRCVETARLLYPEQRPVTVNDLREYSFGPFEGKTAEELRDSILFQKWMRDSAAASEAGAEPLADFERRIVRGLDSVLRDMMKSQVGEAALVLHGGVLATLLSKCGLPRYPASEWNVGGGKGYTLLINVSLWHSSQLGEIFTPVPYGFEKERVVLDYQRDFSEDAFAGLEDGDE